VPKADSEEQKLKNLLKLIKENVIFLNVLKNVLKHVLPKTNNKRAKKQLILRLKSRF